MKDSLIELKTFIDAENRSLMVNLDRIVEIVLRGDFSDEQTKKLMLTALKQKFSNFQEAMNKILEILDSCVDSATYQEQCYNPSDDITSE